MKAIRLHQHGGPDVFVWEDVALDSPAADEVQVRHTVVGVNYSDVNLRRGGFYRSALPLPAILGNEAVGVVEEVGADVTSFSVGDRVGYVKGRGAFYLDTGSYAEARNLPADRLVRLPDSLSDEQVASVMLKGLTALTVIRKCRTPRAGDTVLIHAAASGVGLLLTTLTARLGATVIGTVGSPAKADLATQHGAAHTVLYRDTDFRDAVRTLAPQGIDIVFDGVGKDTFVPSMDVMRRYGSLINYGNASGPTPPFDLLTLASKGSLWINRVAVELVDLGFYREALDELFSLLIDGAIEAHTSRVYPLEQASSAHADLDAGRTAGSILLQVG